MSWKVKTTILHEPLLVEQAYQLDELRRSGLLVEVLEELADAEGEKEVTDDGKQEAADQDQAAGSPDEEGQGGRDVSPSVRTQGEGAPEAVLAADAAAGELRDQLRGRVTPPGGVSQGEGRRPQGHKDAS